MKYGAHINRPRTQAADPDVGPGQKRCPKCREIKPLSEYYRLGYTGRVRPPCKICKAAGVAEKKLTR